MTDDELIARAVAEAVDLGQTDRRCYTAEDWLAEALYHHTNLRRAVARHLLSRDPETVRIRRRKQRHLRLDA